jgi:hypothetical protein
MSHDKTSDQEKRPTVTEVAESNRSERCGDEPPVSPLASEWGPEETPIGAELIAEFAGAGS